MGVPGACGPDDAEDGLAAVDLPLAALQVLLGRPFRSDSGCLSHGWPWFLPRRDSATGSSANNGPRIVQDVVSVFSTRLDGRLAPTRSNDVKEPAFRQVIDYISEHLTEPVACPDRNR